VPCSFDGANFRQDKEKGAENTLCIVKPFDAVLAEIGPSKPCSYWRHQAIPKDALGLLQNTKIAQKPWS
jgi:hypothetical protein